MRGRGPPRTSRSASSSSPTSSWGCCRRSWGMTTSSGASIPRRSTPDSSTRRPCSIARMQTDASFAERQRHDVGQDELRTEVTGGRGRLDQDAIVVGEITDSGDDLARPDPGGRGTDRDERAGTRPRREGGETVRPRRRNDPDADTGVCGTSWPPSPARGGSRWPRPARSGGRLQADPTKLAPSSPTVPNEHPPPSTDRWAPAGNFHHFGFYLPVMGSVGEALGRLGCTIGITDGASGWSGRGGGWRRSAGPAGGCA